jgi:hypothetical protein
MEMKMAGWLEKETESPDGWRRRIGVAAQRTNSEGD